MKEMEDDVINYQNLSIQPMIINMKQFMINRQDMIH